MKFFELFWPREMKEDIEKFRESGVLNERALKTYRGDTFLGFFVFITLGVMCAINSQIILGLSVCLVAPI